MTKSTLEILIGDDLFADPMVSRSVKRNLESLRQAIAGYEINLTYANTPEEVLHESKTQKYHTIVTDLDYGTTGRVGTEGFEIIEEIANTSFTNKPYIILCTSQDTHKEAIQKKIDEHKMDVVIGPNSFNKFTALKDYLIEYYSQKRVPAEGEKPLQPEGGEKNERKNS